VNLRSVVLVLAVVSAAALPLAAQSGAFMDSLLAQDRVSYGDASYLVLVGAGRLKESEPVDRALELLREQGWAIAGKSAGDRLSLGEFSLIVMRCFDIPGGLMYHLAPGPRYATRELVYREVIQGKARPGSSLSGERAARILGRVLDTREAQ
jgi:hypothetical protein